MLTTPVDEYHGFSSGGFPLYWYPMGSTNMTWHSKPCQKNLCSKSQNDALSLLSPVVCLNSSLRHTCLPFLAPPPGTPLTRLGMRPKGQRTPVFGLNLHRLCPFCGLISAKIGRVGKYGLRPHMGPFCTAKGKERRLLFSGMCFAV